MAGRLIWSPRSLQELDDIADFIAKDSPFYARMVVGQVIDRAEMLPEMPGQGRRVPEYDGPLELREVFVHGWRIIYCPTDAGVEVVTIVHGARLIANTPPL